MGLFSTLFAKKAIVFYNYSILASKYALVYPVDMDYRAIILSIRSDYLRDKITLEEAKAKVQPLLEEMNAKGKQISKENQMPFKPLTFSYVFR